VNRINLQPRKGGIVVHLGKDFWFILKILRMIIEVLSKLGKEENSDTEPGKE